MDGTGNRIWTEAEASAWRRFFHLAGVWNLCVGLVFLGFEVEVRRLVGMRPERDPYISQLFFLIVILLGWGYARVGDHLERDSDVLRIGMVAKVLVLGLAVVHAVAGGLPWLMVTPGLVDGWFAWHFRTFLARVAQG